MHTPTRSVRSSPVQAAWGGHVISPVNEALQFGHLPFQGRQGRIAPLSGSTFSLLNKQLCKTLFSFCFHGIPQRMSMCTSLPSSNGATR